MIPKNNDMRKQDKSSSGLCQGNNISADLPFVGGKVPNAFSAAPKCQQQIVDVITGDIYKSVLIKVNWKWNPAAKVPRSSSTSALAAGC